VEIETDDGRQLSGKGVEEGLLEDWDLDLEEYRRKAHLESRRSRTPPKLVHKLMFSMPAGTQPDKVLGAVKAFAREEFGLKHRYAMVLHTDEPHPHVHVVIKAMSEQGQRLHIRRATLREWRAEFARHLRALGVAANATPRYVRGETKQRKLDGVYRAGLRGESTHMRERAEVVARELAKGGLRVEASKAKVLVTRAHVKHEWRAVSTILMQAGHIEAATEVNRFLNEMPPPWTEKESIAHLLTQRSQNRTANGNQGAVPREQRRTR
jgi:hypothetical protein